MCIPLPNKKYTVLLINKIHFFGQKFQFIIQYAAKYLIKQTFTWNLKYLYYENIILLALEIRWNVCQELKTVVCIKHESLMKCTFKPASPYYMYHNSIL